MDLDPKNSDVDLPVCSLERYLKKVRRLLSGKACNRIEFNKVKINRVKVITVTVMYYVSSLLAPSGALVPLWPLLEGLDQELPPT